MYGKAMLLFLIVGGVMALSVALKKLTLAGAITGGMLALCIYSGAGFKGLALLGGFFVLGVGATAVKKSWKETAGVAKKGESKRTAWQVFANGGMAAILGLLILMMPQQALLLQSMLAASLASATADTLSSELGMVYGRRFYNIKTMKPDTRGLDGVISWEGTLLGLVGSILIALIYAAGFGCSKILLEVVIAGTCGNLFDSLLGAFFERNGSISNNAVNFLNTFFAALVMALFLAVL